MQSFASLFFLALLLVPALDRRFGWSAVPPAIVVLGDVAVLVGLTIVFFVFRENTFTSGIIEVREDQRLVSTGPYRIVRHPMYAGALLMLGFIPLALGSFVALVFFVPMLVVIVWRLVDEEHHLAERLAGYEDYRRKTRYRLVPLVW
ncbi:MAG: isoprenylcysteine carboxylmethyltransferase family protein [Chloroflexi bacterium]|nr:MAG: isoprenylcysteine carboxylmethyltransferase family protein [Chloroflexota bacterium]